MSARRRRTRRWWLLLLLPLLLELALQAAAPLIQRALARQPSADAPLRLLCVGDSNTYGLHVPASYSYPGQLQARLARRYPAGVSVSNRGVPGQNTAQVAANLAQDLAEARPHVLLVLAGINNAWSTTGEQRGLAGFWEGLRLVRLARVLGAGVTTAQPFQVSTDATGAITVDRGGGAERVNTNASSALRSGEELAASVESGLRQIVALAVDHGARPVLMTYPEFQGDYGVVNAAIRSTAQALGVPLIDHERGFAEHFAREGYSTLMFNDHHLNLAGYALMARDLEGALSETGLLPAARTAALGPTGPTTPSASPTAPTLQVLAGGELEATGPAGWEFQLVLARAGGAEHGFFVGSRNIPLANDDILALARLSPGLSGRFPESGRLRLAVPQPLRAAADGQPLWACLILLTPLSEAEAEPVAAVTPEVLVPR
ncbi:MAG: SGNH/GDSL hydrolase family protein [Planctomycetota bacterium]